MRVLGCRVSGFRDSGFRGSVFRTPGPYQEALRTQNRRLLGLKTIHYKAFRLFGALGLGFPVGLEVTGLSLRV